MPRASQASRREPGTQPGHGLYVAFRGMRIVCAVMFGPTRRSASH